MTLYDPTGASLMMCNDAQCDLGNFGGLEDFREGPPPLGTTSRECLE